MAQKDGLVYQYPPAIERLIESLLCLPTVGPKTAGRLAFYLLDAPAHEVDEMIAALQGISTAVLRCEECGNYASDRLCSICASARRDRTMLCVVAQPKDIVAFERTGEFRGLYHVLGGLISPMEGRGPEHLRIDHLEQRLRDGEFVEVVLATDPTVAGEATALYLEQILDDYPGQISRLALGIPVGSDFEVTDEVTLGRALSYRQKVSRKKLVRILGRDIAPGRVPRVVQLLLTAAYRAVVKFSDPLTVLRCYLRRTPPPGNRLSLRGGGELALSSYSGDIVTAFVVFCKEEYGTDFAGKTVLDIGANIGCFALLACRHGCRDLVAVEPSPEAFEVLSGNLVGNGFQGRTRVIHAAVSGVQQGSVAFPRASSAMNSLDATEGDLVQVPTVTLGALLEQHFPAGLDLLKLDCEGAEVAILAEASDADLQKVGEIRMEFHGADHRPTEQRLHRAGFRTVLYDRPGPLTAHLWLRRG